MPNPKQRAISAGVSAEDFDKVIDALLERAKAEKDNAGSGAWHMYRRRIDWLQSFKEENYDR